jgi:3D (Asp-Asp-Asp) domain-containing protein
MEKKNAMTLFVAIIIGLFFFALAWPLRPPALAEETEISLGPRIKRMLVTAYCPCGKCCGKYADGKTSIGRNAWKTFGVAADPNVLPYRTKLKIPNIGIREVDDTGGAMRQSTKQGICHIDIRFHSHKEALEFGRRWLNVEILN